MVDDIDALETREWLDALQAVIRHSGGDRATYLLAQLSEVAASAGLPIQTGIQTPYKNTIAPERERQLPGDRALESRIRALTRWNALAMVMRANDNDDGLGGHMATFASAATLYDVGFNHFWRGQTDGQLGDLIYFQGHSSPGMYARAYLEGRLTEEQLDNFRREVDGKGLSSYPHPWLMPDFWQFPTVSMGLGPILSIYQAHVMRYMNARDMAPEAGRKIWAFLGDGECDEPETLGALTLAAREHLDNLIFVVNCNLQRLDGPVRGNGKIVQELEGVFRGAGWNVIKVLWGQGWDKLLEKDKTGLLQKRMDEVVDGEMQNFKAFGGGYTREHFFGKYPELLELVKDLSDDDIMALNRGGHDPQKVYAAYAEAVAHKGQPTVILAQTVKGYAMGAAAQSANVAHSVKKLDFDALKTFRDRYEIPVSDEDLKKVPYFRPAEDSPEMQYIKSRRATLGGHVPSRKNTFEPLEVPSLDTLSALLKSSGDREISTTMAFVRILTTLLKDKTIGSQVVPIIPDEARTFGMEGLFRTFGIYAAKGQKYVPHDSSQIMVYKEDERGQILEEGINEAGAMSSWINTATAYSTYGKPMIPFYIYYSMFGFQRVGDLCWLAGDIRARGFLIGATAGRTTLNGEGLQHQDGHSHLVAATIPSCRSYDPTYSFELAVIIQDGMRRMYQERESCFYYITTMNENYPHPELPEGVNDGIIRGIYKLKAGAAKAKKRVQLMGAGSILREVEAAAELLRNDFGIESDIWSVTSVNELARDGQRALRNNRMHPEQEPVLPYLTQVLKGAPGPIIIATDYMKSYAEQLRAFVPAPYYVLGTDGFGRSDTRAKLREFFEVDRRYIAITALKALADAGALTAKDVTGAIAKYGLNPDKADPTTV